MGSLADLFTGAETGRIGLAAPKPQAAPVVAPVTPEDVFDVIVIGSGPAGYAAAIYLGRDSRSTLVLASEGLPGGQLTNTTAVENYPGFPEGIQGPDLMARMEEQARRFGARFQPSDAVAVDLSSDPFVVSDSTGATHAARSVIVASGSHHRTLNVAGEHDYAGHGVSYCAVCDAAFFKGRDVIVVGGGDTALSDALMLSRVAAHVTIVHRRSVFSGARILQDRVASAGNISARMGSVVSRIIGDGRSVTGVEVAPFAAGGSDGESGSATIPADGVFVSIGSDPSTAFLGGALRLDERGYIVTAPHSTATSVPGVFAAGDVADPHYQQAVVAAGSGAQAALDAMEWLDR